MAQMTNPKPLPETKNVSTFNPRGQLALGKQAADALIEVVKKAGLARNLGGKEYLFYEAWLTLARFFRLTPKVEWTRPFRLEEGGKIVGWEARAVVVNEDGREVAAAEAFCGRDEKNWEKRPHYALRSMAQTRACAKALRSVLSWIVVLAGFQPTPAEEINGDELS